MSSETRSFEKLLEEIKGIVDALETGKLPLDESIEKFEKGAGLVKECYEKLEGVKKKVSMVIERNGGALGLEDFDDEPE